jgi:hypothetical protein
MEVSPSSWQPVRQPWTLERLIHERSILLGLSIDNSTALAYTSALNSYLTFCRIHDLPIDPTPETLSFYITFQSTFISPSSVDSYLSGICNQLEPFFPTVRLARKSPIVVKTLKGARRRHGVLVKRKAPLAREDLFLTLRDLASSSHDDFLFAAMIFTGFHGLLRLGELTVPDKMGIRDYRKVTSRLTVELLPSSYAFTLPAHKADTYFEGNRVLVQCTELPPNPVPIFARYLASRDRLFPWHQHLWVTSAGGVPQRAWFMKRLCQFFPSSIAGHSMRAGGATALAQAGAAPELIKAAGRWSSDAFERYVRKNPVLMHALILGRSSAFDGPVEARLS